MNAKCLRCRCRCQTEDWCSARQMPVTEVPDWMWVNCEWFEKQVRKEVKE